MPRYLLVILLLLPFCGKGQVITTIAGNGQSGYSGDGGLATAAGIGYFNGIAIDSIGNVYIANSGHNRIRKVDYLTGMITTIAGNGSAGFSGDGGLAINAELNAPEYIAIDKQGDIYISDVQNYRIRKIDAATQIITTVAGNGVSAYAGDGGNAISASFMGTGNIVVDKNDNLYVIDFGIRIRKVSSSGQISLIAGEGTLGYGGDGGLAVQAKIAASGIAVDTNNGLYIGEVTNGRIRKVNLSNGLISTFAGNGSLVYAGDGILASSTAVVPAQLTFDKNWSLYLSEQSGSNRIRKIDQQGIIYTIAGNGTNGFSGDGGLAVQAQLHTPATIALDSSGSLYFADQQNKRVRKILFPVSVNEHKQISFSLYPNPANTNLIITGDNLQNIIITNTLGQVVNRQQATAEKTVVDISSLNAGVYFVSVTDALGGKVVRKVVKE